MSEDRRPPSEDVLVSELRARLGEDAVAGDGRAFAIAGRAPACAVFPSSVAQVSEVMAFAGDRSLAVVPCGNATHLHTGSPPRRYDIALSLRRLAQVRAHEAADMTVTVDAGMTLAGLNAELASARQWLPLDPPLSDRVTAGGLIAADLNGPLRLSQGKVRDLLIGITVVLADGKVTKAGGRVVKNVAGYDLGKLFTGSRGTLGVIVEATFKVRPRPDHMRIVCVVAPDLAAAAELGVAVLDTGIAPLFVELLDADHVDGTGSPLPARAPGIAIGLAGIREEVDAQ